MKLARIKSVVITEALKSRNFFSLSCYLDSFTKTPENHFISPFHEDLKIWDLEACLMDYCCNEQESRELYNLAEKLIGKRTIDLQVLKEVTI